MDSLEAVPSPGPSFTLEAPMPYPGRLGWSREGSLLSPTRQGPHYVVSSHGGGAAGTAQVLTTQPPATHPSTLQTPLFSEC